MYSSIKIVNGNYVIHFLSLLTADQLAGMKGDIHGGYNQALANAKPFGGRKFNNKAFGGGIGFDYQADAEKALEAFTTCWAYTVDHPEHKIEWLGKMTLADSRKHRKEGRTVYTYLNEETYNEMKANAQA